MFVIVCTLLHLNRVTRHRDTLRGIVRRGVFATHSHKKHSTRNTWSCVCVKIGYVELDVSCSTYRARFLPALSASKCWCCS